MDAVLRLSHQASSLRSPSQKASSASDAAAEVNRPCPVIRLLPT
nr:hypothetical protein [Paludibacterium paludis]